MGGSKVLPLPLHAHKHLDAWALVRLGPLFGTISTFDIVAGDAQAIVDKTDQSWAACDSNKGTILQKVHENDQTVYGSYLEQ